MSDDEPNDKKHEPPSPDEVNALIPEFAEHLEKEGTGGYVFFINQHDGGASMDDNAWKAFRAVRATWPMPYANGSKAPRFEVSAERCEQGCHITIVVTDAANGERYEIQRGLPWFVAVMTGYVDMSGEINPRFAHDQLLRMRSVLN